MTNNHQNPQGIPPRPQLLVERAAATLERFLHVEAVSGAVLLVAAAIALIWANSPFGHSYEALWHTPLAITLGEWTFDRSLHFWINDGLMAIFFLVVGMEIRREIHEGALSSPRQAALPMAAAFGGVIAPALIFFALTEGALQRSGWAVPTATDIAFAVGVLALLGKGIPGNVRVILLTLAIVDDVIAVIIIAVFYSGGLQPAGLLIAAAGVLIVLFFQRAGVASAWSYLLPGAITWTGIMMTGAHPALAGVILGLITPVRSLRGPQQEVRRLASIAQELAAREIHPIRDAGDIARPLREIGSAGRDVLPPVVRVQLALHPWVAFGVMPLFALANAGVEVHAGEIAAGGATWVMAGVAIALVVGKPLGIFAVSWLMVRTGLCRMPPGVSWGGIALVGLLGGIGFTMSIFIAMLAYTDRALLDAAKLGVLTGSFIAALLGLAWGALYVRRLRD